MELASDGRALSGLLETPESNIICSLRISGADYYRRSSWSL